MAGFSEDNRIRVEIDVMGARHAPRIGFEGRQPATPQVDARPAEGLVMPDAQGASIENQSVIIRLADFQVGGRQDLQRCLDVDDTPLLARKRMGFADRDGLGLQKVNGRAIVIGQGGITVDGILLTGIQGVAMVGVREGHAADRLDAVGSGHDTDQGIAVGAIIEER